MGREPSTLVKRVLQDLEFVAGKEESPWNRMLTMIILDEMRAQREERKRERERREREKAPAPQDTPDLGTAIGDAIVDGALADPKAYPGMFRTIQQAVTSLDARVVGLEHEVNRHAGIQERLHIEIEELTKGLDSDDTLLARGVDKLAKRIVVLEGSYVQERGKLLDVEKELAGFEERAGHCGSQKAQQLVDIETRLKAIEQVCPVLHNKQDDEKKKRR